MAENEKPKKGIRGWKKVLLTILVVILAVILLLLLAVTIYWNAMLNRINRMEETTAATLSEADIQQIMDEVNAPDAEDTTYPTDPLVTEEEEIIGDSDAMINIMLVGQDISSDDKGRRGRSDVMILCTINTEEKTITFTSFMRDIYLKLPEFNGRDYGYNRLNTNYVFGGREMLDLCMQQNFGIYIDHFVEVDFNGFAGIVDIMGGVDIELTEAEAWYMNLGYPEWRMRSGQRHLNGNQALTYARIREIDNDFNRTQRQRNVLNSLMGKLKQMSPAQLHEILSAALPMLTTDMTNDEITKYTFQLIPMLGELQVQNLRIPVDDGFYYARKGSGANPMAVIVADLEKNRQVLKETLGDDLFYDD